MAGRPHGDEEPSEPVAGEPAEPADDEPADRAPVEDDRAGDGQSEAQPAGDDTAAAGPDGSPASGAPSPGEAAVPADDPQDVETRWQEIVAQLGDLGAAGTPPPVPRRRAGDAPAGDAPSWGAARTVRPSEPPEPADPREPTGPRSWAPDPAVEEAEDHFVPPDPGPVLGGDPLLTMAWVVVVAVPLLLLLSVVVWRDAPRGVLQGAGVAFLLAVGLLLWRMPHRRDEDDRGPGAVV